jgi:hypothetical protein
MRAQRRLTPDGGVNVSPAIDPDACTLSYKRVADGGLGSDRVIADATDRVRRAETVIRR